MGFNWFGDGRFVYRTSIKEIVLVVWCGFSSASFFCSESTNRGSAKRFRYDAEKWLVDWESETVKLPLEDLQSLVERSTFSGGSDE